MKIYNISGWDFGIDEYIGFVVVAYNVAQARSIAAEKIDEDQIKDMKCEMIGTYEGKAKESFIVLESFNPG